MRKLIQILMVSFSLLAVGAAAAGAELHDLIETGQSQAASGRLDDALATFTTAAQTYPDSSLAHTRLGGVRVLRQEYSRGIEEFQQAIMLDQANANAFIGLAVAYLHLGQHAHAKAALKEAEKLDVGKGEQIRKLLAWIDTRSNSRRVH